jgi:hypothetical protein
MAAIRSALDSDEGEGNWTAFNGALQRRLLRTDRFLGNTMTTPVEENPALHATAGGGDSPNGNE